MLCRGVFEAGVWSTTDGCCLFGGARERCLQITVAECSSPQVKHLWVPASPDGGRCSGPQQSESAQLRCAKPIGCAMLTDLCKCIHRSYSGRTVRVVVRSEASRVPSTGGGLFLASPHALLPLAVALSAASSCCRHNKAQTGPQRWPGKPGRLVRHAHTHAQRWRRVAAGLQA